MTRHVVPNMTPHPMTRYPDNSYRLPLSHRPALSCRAADRYGRYETRPLMAGRAPANGWTRLGPQDWLLMVCPRERNGFKLSLVEHAPLCHVSEQERMLDGVFDLCPVA